ncbi:MAG: TRASH domain-containing protein [Candidatus Freyarchaeota archaeon]|nr:TRASH domain-containing protein [Candidatus Jordarchaeia archaeon]
MRGGGKMRCQTCGQLIKGKPITRKTCCVNKLYVFCSESCMKKWSQNWLTRQI